MMIVGYAVRRGFRIGKAYGDGRRRTAKEIQRTQDQGGPASHSFS